MENYKAKWYPRTTDHNYLTIFMQFQPYLFSLCPVTWNISGRLSNCMELSLWEYKWNAQIFKDRQQAQKNNVIWDVTKYIQKTVLIHNHQIAKEFGICSGRMCVFLIYVPCLRASLQSKQCMAHLPKQTDQMEQLVYYAVSVCFRSTTVERRPPECVGHRWSKKATYGNPKTTMQPEESLSKNFEEIIPIIAEKGVGGRQARQPNTKKHKAWIIILATERRGVLLACSN